MKLSPLQHVVAQARQVVRRFPLTLLCSFILCAAGIYQQRLSPAMEQK
ncbi:hypothetical protein [Hymenobacter elongatus]|nr:hypothetical protein [Hymenobacter elongatus]